MIGILRELKCLIFYKLDMSNVMQKYQHAVEISDLLKVISNPARLVLLCLLLQRQRNVSDLLDSIDISQSAISQHLAILREKNIIKAEKHGKYVFYSIKDARIVKILGFLSSICE